MSIDTLLEAARYLEWLAQHQKITRGKLIGAPGRTDMTPNNCPLHPKLPFGARGGRGGGGGGEGEGEGDRIPLRSTTGLAFFNRPACDGRKRL